MDSVHVQCKGQLPRTETVMPRTGPRKWWTLVAVSLATFMTYLDNNVTNVAIPTIQRSLHLSVAGLEWVVSGYVLVFAGLMLVGGRLADVYGRRRLFLIGLSVFTLASLAAGLAGSGGVLIASRAAQGLGAALLVPTTLAIIIATFEDGRERTRAIGLWTAIGALALAFGPLFGGFISQNVRWGWIFFINVPVGVITFAIAAAEARSAHPMVQVSLFRSRVFSGGTSVIMLWAFGIFGIYFFTSLYLQGILGFSPIEAGLAFVPMALFLALFAGVSGPVVTRIGTQRTIALGLVIMLAGLYLFARQGLHATYAGLMPGFLLFGAGSGLMNAPLTSAVLSSMPPHRSGVASALLNAAREVAVLLSRQGAALHHGLPPASAFLDGYHAGLAVTVALTAAGIIVTMIALRRTGAPPVPAPAPAELVPQQAARRPEPAAAVERLG